MPKIFIAVLLLLSFTLNGHLKADSSLEKLRPFLKQHCDRCHGPEEQEGDYRFDKLGTDLTDLKTLETWQAVLDQLNLGEMPPKSSPQPNFKETAKVIEALTPALKKAYAARKSTGGRTVIPDIYCIQVSIHKKVRHEQNSTCFCF